MDATNTRPTLSGCFGAYGAALRARCQGRNQVHRVDPVATTAPPPNLPAIGHPPGWYLHRYLTACHHCDAPLWVTCKVYTDDADDGRRQEVISFGLAYNV